MNDIVARGMLNPRAWYVMVPNPRSTDAVPPGTLAFLSDGKYCPDRRLLTAEHVYATVCRGTWRSV